MSKQFTPKTNWQKDDIVTEHDFNRIEQGIAECFTNTEAKVNDIFNQSINVTGDFSSTGSLKTDNVKIQKQIENNKASSVIVNDCNEANQQRIKIKNSSLSQNLGFSVDYSTDNGNTWSSILDVSKDNIEWNGDSLSTSRLKFAITQFDSDGNAIEVEYRRLDNSLFLKKEASNPDLNGFYQTVNEKYYELDGSSLKKQIKFSLLYNKNGLIISNDGGVEVNE